VAAEAVVGEGVADEHDLAREENDLRLILSAAVVQKVQRRVELDRTTERF